MKHFIHDLGNNNRKEINEADYELLKTNAEQLSHFSEEIDYYRMGQLNYQQFVSLQGKIKVRSYDNLVILNTAFDNYLNSYYVWKSYHNKYDPKSTDDFTVLQNRYGEKFPEYMLFDVLRNVAIHNSYLITKIEFDVLTEKVHYIINCEIVINDEKVNEMLRKWLKEKIENNQSFEAIETAQILNDHFTKIQHDLWKSYSPNISTSYKRCVETIGLGNNLYNLQLEKISESSRDYYPFGQIFTSAVMKIQDNYPKGLLPIMGFCTESCFSGKYPSIWLCS